MPTQDLVPDGLPYGERQQRSAAMRQAGLPLESSPTQPGAGEGTGAVSPPQSASAPSPDLDALSMLSPSPSLAGPPITDQDRLAEVAATTPNTFMAAMIRRVLADDS